MALTSALNTLATFSTETHSVSDFGEQKTTRTVLYADIPAKIKATKNAGGAKTSLLGEQEFFEEGWNVIVDGVFSEANIGDNVSVNEKNYTIVKKWRQKGKVADYFCYFVM